MKLLSRLRLRTRLTVAFGLLIVLLVATALLGVSMVRGVHAGLRSVYETKTVPMQQLEEINTIVLSSRIALMEMIDNPTTNGIDAAAASLRGDLKRVDELWKSYTATPLDDELKRVAQDVGDARNAYIEQGLVPAIDALKAGKVFDAKAINAQKISPLAQGLQRATAKLMSLQIEAAGKEYAEATNTLQASYGTSALATAVGVLLGIVLSSMVTRSVTQPVAEAINASDRINRGDLSGNVSVRYGDEMGQLLTALSTMRASLASLVRTVRGNAESVASTSRTLAQQSTDVARRTDDQAVSLKQLTTAVIDLELSVKQNASNASSAAQAARAASGTAHEGGSLMGQLVGTMKQISESSNRISEIVGRIESIAFQTNILSLNAAAEASRAGETGSGFAAVATEVRNLASSCGQAAKEIKGLIGDSLTRVANGAALVSKAGATMDHIVGGIHEVSLAMEQINTASAEQSKNVGQFGTAIKRLESLGRQNSEVGRHSASAADGLRSQAEDLVETVAVFKLSESDETAA